MAKDDRSCIQMGDIYVPVTITALPDDDQNMEFSNPSESLLPCIMSSSDVLTAHNQVPHAQAMPGQ